MNADPDDPVADEPSLDARLLWRWFRLVGVPIITIMAIVTAVVMLRAPSESSGTAGGADVAGENGAVPLDLSNVGADDVKAAPEVGLPAPDFALQGLDGKTYRLSDLRGQAVLINFWATWCGPCKSEMPAIEEAFKQRAGDGLVVLAINVREGTGEVQSFVSKLGLTFSVLLDRSGTVSRRYRVTGLPTTYLINRDGTVDGMRVGPYTRPMLLGRLDQLLGTE